MKYAADWRISMRITGSGQGPRLASSQLPPESRMVRAINSVLESMLGWSGAQVLNFHVDIRNAPANPLKYQEELRTLLGPPSAAVVKRIMDALCLESGQSQKPACRGIEGCLSCLRRNGKTSDVMAGQVQITFHSGV